MRFSPVEMALARTEHLAKVHGVRERPVALDDADQGLELFALFRHLDEDPQGLELVRPGDDPSRVEESQQGADLGRLFERRETMTGEEVQCSIEGDRSPSEEALDESLCHRLTQKCCLMRGHRHLVVAEDEDAFVEGLGLF